MHLSAGNFFVRLRGFKKLLGREARLGRQVVFFKCIYNYITQAFAAKALVGCRSDYHRHADGNCITDEQGNKILDEEADYSGYYRDILWKNKAITELYYPGSVFKVITSAMGIDSGVATMNTTFTCSGAYGVAKETYHCAGRKAHGLLNMAEALRKSCNIY